MKQNIGVFPFQQASIPLEVARIGRKIFVGTELRRVHENGDTKRSPRFSPCAQDSDARSEENPWSEQNDSSSVAPFASLQCASRRYAQ